MVLGPGVNIFSGICVRRVGSGARAQGKGGGISRIFRQMQLAVAYGIIAPF